MFKIEHNAEHYEAYMSPWQLSRAVIGEIFGHNRLRS